MKKQNVRTLSLIVCTFTYLLVGAALFDALESSTERARYEVLQAIEGIIIRKYNISEEDFRVMETIVLKSEPHKAGQQWKFTGAFYYATTVLTTIGYGHSTPMTIGGKLFTMFYAAIGIPLGLIMFQSIGERVNCLSSIVIQSIKKAFNCKQTNATELDLICVVTTLSSLTIAGGAAAFSNFEGWSYFDSVYYCFITLTTIGFGDMVALQKDNALNKKPSYVMFALIFILFGLAIVAACLNLLVLRFVTMNTEDERRDERQAQQALRGAVRLEGDIITADGEILRGVSKGTRLPADPRLLTGDASLQPLCIDNDDAASVCSCKCNCFGHRYVSPYHDPLSPVPPTNLRQIRSKCSQNIPRYIEKSQTRSNSQTLRLNSASGYLFMNAKGNEFQIDSDDFQELMTRRREQLRQGMELDNVLSPYNDDYQSMCNNDYSYNMINHKSEEPLLSLDDRQLKRNIDRNVNYFYDDDVLHFDENHGSPVVYARRRKDAEQVSNDGSFGYYLPPEDEENQYFVNDTLTLAQPDHRASI